MNLCCTTCAEHIAAVEDAMGGRDVAQGVVRGLGGPLRPSPSTFLSLAPEAYLRVASDELVRALATGGASGLPLVEAIELAQIVDIFFDREGVLGFADGDLSWLRRTWTFHRAGHMDSPDPSWRLRVLAAITGNLGIPGPPDAPQAPRALPPSVPADDGDRTSPERRGRGGGTGWGTRGGDWDAWQGDAGWAGRGWGWGDERGSGRGSGDHGRVRPRSPGRYPWGQGEARSDGSRSDSRAASRRRRLSSPGTGASASVFARDLRAGLFGRVIDVDGGSLVRLHDARGNPRSACVTFEEWIRRYQFEDGGVEGPACDSSSDCGTLASSRADRTADVPSHRGYRRPFGCPRAPCSRDRRSTIRWSG